MKYNFMHYSHQLSLLQR